MWDRITIYNCQQNGLYIARVYLHWCVYANWKKKVWEHFEMQIKTDVILAEKYTLMRGTQAALGDTPKIDRDSASVDVEKKK